MANADIELYKELLTYCDEIREKQRERFSGNLKFREEHERWFKDLYVNQQNTKQPLAPKHFRQTDKELDKLYPKFCGFYTEQRSNMIKGLDIQHGHWFENAFRQFLADKGIETAKKGHPFPDIEVQSKDGKAKAYFELKYIRSPFVYANSVVRNEKAFPYPERWDYESSLTLDVEEKLTKQRSRVEELYSEGVPSYYVWWYDAPHLKGIFYETAKAVYKYWDQVGTIHERKQRKGDEIDKQVSGKIYPPLLNMKSLSNLIQEIS